MKATARVSSLNGIVRCSLMVLVAQCAASQGVADGQGFTGTLTITVKNEQGGVVKDAIVTLTSPDVAGQTKTTNENGEVRFPALRLGAYELQIEHQGYNCYSERAVQIWADQVRDIRAILKVQQRITLPDVDVVVNSGPRLELKSSGLETRVSLQELQDIPSRRYGPFGVIGSALGMSRTSPSSGTNNHVAAFGSSVNESQFNQDGTNFTCPCAGVSRAEPSLDFIQEVQIQSVGVSPEYGNLQGSVFNVVTKEGGNRSQYNSSYYSQLSGLTSQPILLQVPGSQSLSGYERIRYRDFTTTLGGPVRRDRVWFFGGYQYLRDYDSQPGTDALLPRAYEQNKFFGKVTSQIKPGMHLMQSLLYESWVNPQIPTRSTPIEATLRYNAVVPTATFGHLTHAVSDKTLYEARLGHFVFPRKDDPSSGDWTIPNVSDRATGVSSGNAAALGALTLVRTTAKAMITRYQDWLGIAHQLKFGGQLEKGGHDQPQVIPSGTRYVTDHGQKFLAVSGAPSNSGGQFITGALFVNDSMSFGDRLTINAGARMDHSRAISQDLEAVDLQGRKTGEAIPGLGTLYTWNVVSPRLGVTVRLDSHTIVRGAYGRFNQGVLTGEISPFHPALAPVTTMEYEVATGDYTHFVSTVDPKVNLLLDPQIRAPRTDEYSLSVDRELGAGFTVGLAYVYKSGRNFIAWTDVEGQYQENSLVMPDGRSLGVFELTNGTSSSRFLLTNPDGYSLKYHGLFATIEKRVSNRLQLRGAYGYSRTVGLQASSGAGAGDSQASTIAAAFPTTMFGRDPNNLTNAYGRLPNDRPHLARVMGTYDLPRTGLTLAANLQLFMGKPWAATAQVALPQGDQRILLEPRGSRRLPSQSMLDLRVSRFLPLGQAGRVELIFDVLNLLNETAAEGLVTDSLYTYRNQTFTLNSNFGRPAVFVDPRRAMLSVRMNLGR